MAFDLSEEIIFISRRIKPILFYKGYIISKTKDIRAKKKMQQNYRKQ
jgi:hypothetical protein